MPGLPLPILWWDSSQGHSIGTPEGFPGGTQHQQPTVLSAPSSFLKYTSQHPAREFFVAVGGWAQNQTDSHSAGSDRGSSRFLGKNGEHGNRTTP